MAVQEQEDGELACVEISPLGALAERVAKRGQHALFAEPVDALSVFIGYHVGAPW